MLTNFSNFIQVQDNGYHILNIGVLEQFQIVSKEKYIQYHL